MRKGRKECMGRRRFFIRKNPGKQEAVKEWIELEGAEFYRFLRTDEAKGRYFIRLGNDGDNECDEIYMEVPKNKYRAWKADENRKLYRRKRNPCRQKVVSLSTSISSGDDEDLTVEDLVGTDDSVTSDPAIRQIQTASLIRHIAELTPGEKELLRMRYWNCMKQEEIAEELGTSQQNIQQRLNRLERKLARRMGEKV